MNGFGDRGDFAQRSFAPVKVGEELDVRIEAVGEKGDGICKKKGFVLFVPNTQEGDEVRIKVTRVLRKVGFAEVVGQPQGPVEGSEEQPQKEEAPADSEDFGEEQVEDSEDFGEESEDSEESDEPAEDSEESDEPAEDSEESDEPKESEPELPSDEELDEEKKE